MTKCKHKIIERDLEGTYRCIDCDKTFDLDDVPLEAMDLIDDEDEADIAEESTHQYKTDLVEKIFTVSGWIIALLIASGGVWGLYKDGLNKIPQVASNEPQVIEKTVEKPVYKTVEKVVYVDKPVYKTITKKVYVPKPCACDPDKICARYNWHKQMKDSTDNIFED